MSIAILQHTPAWVWAVFVALIAYGLTQTRPREMGLLRVTLLPLAMIALSLSGVFRAFGHAPLALGGWAAGVGAALSFARNLVEARGARWLAASGTIHVPGSWLPLALIVGLFAVKYVAGAGLAIRPALAADPLFAGLCGLGYGSFGGLLLARGWGLRRLADRSQALQTART
ncbi:MAG TPA: DUF6622 family protein [Burkholderiaceae bacterium]|nr:DUF6622 family protein [Burkholderiaceae bacterium]